MMCRLTCKQYLAPPHATHSFQLFCMLKVGTLKSRNGLRMRLNYTCEGKGLAHFKHFLDLVHHHYIIVLYYIIYINIMQLTAIYTCTPTLAVSISHMTRSKTCNVIGSPGSQTVNSARTRKQSKCARPFPLQDGGIWEQD